MLCGIETTGFPIAQGGICPYGPFLSPASPPLLQGATLSDGKSLVSLETCELMLAVFLPFTPPSSGSNAVKLSEMCDDFFCVKGSQGSKGTKGFKGPRMR